MSIVIALVAEKNGRITEIAEVKGKILKTANLIVKKFEPSQDDRKCFEENGYYFCVLADSGTVYLAATASSTNQRLGFQFLDTIKNEYNTRGYLNKDDLTQFEDFIEEKMDLFSNHPEQVDKIKGLQRKVDDVKDVAMGNLNSLLIREENINSVQSKADGLQSGTKRFDTAAKKLKCLELRRNVVVTIVLIICCLILLGILIGILWYLLK